MLPGWDATCLELHPDVSCIWKASEAAERHCRHSVNDARRASADKILLVLEFGSETLSITFGFSSLAV